MDAGRGFSTKVVGLGARDVLRIEAGYPLYGHELSKETSPIEAGLSWAVRLDKERFIGKEAIEAHGNSGPTSKLVGLEAVGRCVPRQGYSLSSASGSVGIVTSGTFSPVLEKGIAMAYVASLCSEAGTQLSIDVRGKPCDARIVRMPFYHHNKV
jgi:aminomethyltransferase